MLALRVEMPGVPKFRGRRKAREGGLEVRVWAMRWKLSGHSSKCSRSHEAMHPDSHEHPLVVPCCCENWLGAEAECEARESPLLLLLKISRLSPPGNSAHADAATGTSVCVLQQDSALAGSDCPSRRYFCSSRQIYLRDLQCLFWLALAIDTACTPPDKTSHRGAITEQV